MGDHTNGKLGRRGFLLGVTGAAGAAILAACGGGLESAATVAPTTAARTGTTAAGAGTVAGGAAATTGSAAGAASTSAATAAGGTTTGAAPAGGTAAVMNSGMATTVVWFSGRDTSGYTPMQVAAFNAANRSIQISYQEQGATTNDLRDKFVAVAAAKDASCDIISMDVPFVPEFAAAGWTIPVTEAVPMAERAKFFEGTLTGATWDNQLFAVPWYNNGPGLYYRKDLLASKGFQPPKTYDELLMQAQALQTPEISGFVMQLNQGEGGFLNWQEYLWGYGGELISNDGKTVLLDRGDAGVRSFQRIVDFIYKDKIMPEATIQLRTGADAMNLFRTGKAVFMRLWYSNGGDLYRPEATIKPEQWDITTLPSQMGMPGPGVLGTWNLGVSKFSRKPKEALEAVRIITDEANQTARTVGNGNLPARAAVFDAPAVQMKFTYAKRAQDSFKALKPRGITPLWGTLGNEALFPNFGAVMTRQKTPEQGIRDMSAKMRDVLKM